MLHGISKLINGIGWLVGMLDGKGLPGVLAYGVYVGEVIAPILLLIGFRTRIAAIIIVINMLVAIFTAHAAEITTMGQSGGWAIELPMMFLLGALALFFLGGGRYAASTRDRWD
ncbi:GntR family transcriptional regulator [Adhaeribacter aerolatus]|uniref:GntR family transcriptional regulator n=1 Tax=Adhaeribacter aerolatus TaxID=670289 RepID=A0A512AZH0_9BACT|nr:GntR family transcriptional regulator [Adhaeribacter aerolatus]